jgi:substrate import-associated zinc metallohydrolase lipoprotein
VKRVWVDTYIAETDDIFLKRYAPKFFTLVGSPAYNSNGTIKLGQAEGGRKVLLYNINNTRVKSMHGYKSGDSAQIKQMVHTIHHEFAHILHQTILYPAEFRNINGNLYSSDWINYTDAEARRDGFVTAYAMNLPDEDFVETLSVMLIEGKEGYEKMIANIPDGVTIRGTTREKAIERLRAKEAIVVNYFKQVWKIDFYSLQDRTRKALEAEIY